MGSYYRAGVWLTRSSKAIVYRARKKRPDSQIVCLRQFLDPIREFFLEDAARSEVFFDNFFFSLRPHPNPQSGFWRKTAISKNGHFPPFGTKSILEGAECNALPPNFLYKVKFFISDPPVKLFLERGLFEHPAALENSRAEPIFQISTLQMGGLRVSERPLFSTWILLKKRKNRIFGPK